MVVFFFADTGVRRLDRARGIVEPYLRASTRIVLVLYALPLGLSLSLVALEPVWSRVLFALLSLLLLAANLDTAAHVRAVARVTGSTALLVNELVGTATVLVITALPWLLGGSIRPDRTSPGLSSWPLPPGSRASPRWCCSSWTWPGSRPPTGGRATVRPDRSPFGYAGRRPSRRGLPPAISPRIGSQ